MFYYESGSTDPSWNLALEEYIFEKMPQDKAYFILWQNDNAVIVGKNQNTIEEINLEYVQNNNIQVVRRLSGGGAVYHDLGNLNYTFITDAAQTDIDFKRFCAPIADTLSTYGIRAELSSRNDLTVAGAKFSGNAQYIKHQRVMHHGTILFDSNISAITQALTPKRKDISSNGQKSSHSRMVNLADILPEHVTLEAFKERLRETVFRNSTREQLILSDPSMREIREIREKKYSTWEWNYGFSPAYTVRREKRLEGCGTIRVSLNTEHGVISDITISGDFFENNEIQQLERSLKGVRYLRDEIGHAVKMTGKDGYIKGCTDEMLVDLICAQDRLP